ncbi:Major Facilitator Superfamily transporter [Streptomyces lincolnensis]|uniref:Major Facilitator Superfamily transporter n=1 Tax=Streptomyces lincolnensis TaxID=1915 RepID=A0A1B1MPX7_STRLN|nr:MFS transporter [Streptomyces lincolnensis]ANS70660.1 Major Facilitator Superfamily transporter [Streptomyces lincolnensis]
MPSASANYRTLLRTSGAAAFFLPAAVGRLGIAMTGIGIVWLVHARTGSYAAAGLVTGGFAVADAVAGPQLGRLVDRFGQVRVLPCALVAHAGAVALLLAGAVPDLVAGVLVGATLPQLGALSAARWSALLSGERGAALPTAFALEALVNGGSYMAGPALVSVLGAAGHPNAGVLLAAVLVVGGGLALAAQRLTMPPLTGHAERRHAGRALLRPAFLRQVALGLTLGVFFGAMQVSVAAYAVGRGTPDAAALLYFSSNCTNLVGGWAYGAWRHNGSPRRHQAAAAACLTLASLPLTVLDAPLAIGATLALTGLAVPVLLILTSVLTQSSVPRAVLTQAFTWGNSASAAGSAAAAAVAGRVVDAGGAHGGFGVAAGAAGAMTVLALGGRRRPRELSK